MTLKDKILKRAEVLAAGNCYKDCETCENKMKVGEYCWENKVKRILEAVNFYCSEAEFDRTSPTIYKAVVIDGQLYIDGGALCAKKE